MEILTKQELLAQVNERINQLEADRTERNGTVMVLRTALAQKEEETQILKEQINVHLFENTEDHRLLQELYIVRKHLQR